MGRGTIRVVILLATLSLIGVVVTQLYWLNTAFEVQEKQIELQDKQYDQLEREFNDRVIIALTNVAEEILSINKDPSELYEAVKQIRSNYFTAAINDTLHPYLLESLLIKEFKRRNINEDFEYGIYDCFTDSVVYGNYVTFNEDGAKSENPSTLVKWDKDGHYFGVLFPNKESYGIEPVDKQLGTWTFSMIIMAIVFVFFAFSIWVILQQKRLSEMKNDFINNMTHELKTPISTISLSSEVLMKDGISKEPERIHQYAKIIKSENERLKNQVERVLQLATLDKDDLELRKEEVDIHEVIRNAVESFKLTLQERNGALSCELSADQYFVTGDPVHLANIVHNLIDNAIKYSINDPEIRINTSNSDRTLIIAVSDNGIGLDKENAQHVFEKFFRVHTGNIHNVKGFGLGLYYVRSMTKAHGGNVSVKSQLGKGSTFNIQLPTINK